MLCPLDWQVLGHVTAARVGDVGEREEPRCVAGGRGPMEKLGDLRRAGDVGAGPRRLRPQHPCARLLSWEALEQHGSEQPHPARTRWPWSTDTLWYMVSRVPNIPASASPPLPSPSRTSAHPPISLPRPPRAAGLTAHRPLLGPICPVAGLSPSLFSATSLLSPRPLIRGNSLRWTRTPCSTLLAFTSSAGDQLPNPAHP